MIKSIGKGELKLEAKMGLLYGCFEVESLDRVPLIERKRSFLLSIKERRTYKVSTELTKDDLLTIYDFGERHSLLISHNTKVAKVTGLTLFEIEKVCLPNFYKYEEERIKTLEELNNKGDNDYDLTKNLEPIYTPSDLLNIDDNEEYLLSKIEGLKLTCIYTGDTLELSSNVRSATKNIAKIELRKPTLRTPYYLLFICYCPPKWLMGNIVNEIDQALHEFDVTVLCCPGYGFPPQEGFMGIALVG